MCPFHREKQGPGRGKVQSRNPGVGRGGSGTRPQLCLTSKPGRPGVGLQGSSHQRAESRGAGAKPA